MNKNKTPQTQDSSGNLTRREFLRRSAIVGASALAGNALLTAGCAPPVVAPPAAAPTAAPTKAPVVKKPVTIKAAHYFDPLQSPAAQANLDWLNSVIDGFKKENPGIEVELEYFVWDQIDNRMILDQQAGVAHDFTFSSPQLMPKHLQIDDFLDLSPYISQWSAQEREDFSWSPVWNKSRQGDAQIGVPAGVHTRAVFYRRDLFEEAGLDPDKPPETWEECLEAAKALTKDGQWGLGMYFGPTRANMEIYFAPFVWHYGGLLWDPETKKATFASEAGVKAAQLVYDLVFTHKVTPESAIAGDYSAVILDGIASNEHAQSWGVGSYWIQPVQDNWGHIEKCFPPNVGCKPLTGDFYVTPTIPHATFTNAWCMSVHKLSEHPDEAVKLLEYAAKAENLFRFPDAGLPARLSMWEAPEYQTPFYQTWLEAARRGRPMPPTAHYPELADTCAAALQEVLVQKSPIPETLKKFEDEWNAKYAGA